MNIGTAVRIFTVSMITATLIFGADRPIEKRGDDSVASVSAEDEAMNRIMVEARRTWPDFARQLANRKDNQRDFMVKYPFETDPGTEMALEHIWLSDLTVKKGKYFGTLANEPFYVKSLKIGQKVEFIPKKISDWKYIEDDYLVGGKSIIYLIKGLSAEERKAMLGQVDFKIRDFE